MFFNWWHIHWIFVRLEWGRFVPSKTVPENKTNTNNIASSLCTFLFLWFNNKHIEWNNLFATRRYPFNILQHSKMLHTHIFWTYQLHSVLLCCYIQIYSKLLIEPKFHMQSFKASAINFLVSNRKWIAILWYCTCSNYSIIKC